MITGHTKESYQLLAKWQRENFCVVKVHYEKTDGSAGWVSGLMVVAGMSQIMIGGNSIAFEKIVSIEHKRKNIFSAVMIEAAI